MYFHLEGAEIAALICTAIGTAAFVYALLQVKGDQPNDK